MKKDNSWRPVDWIENISFEELRKISPSLVSMMTIKERKIYEAGADAMLKSCREHWEELVPKDQICLSKTDYSLATGVKI